MNNLERILERINSDAEREIAEINAECERRCEEIRQELDDRLSDMEKRTESAAMKEYQRIIARAESAGTMNERRTILAAKSELVEKVYRDAAEFILRLPDDKYAEIMSRLLADAIIAQTDTVRDMTETYSDNEFSADAKLPFDVLLSASDRERHSRDIIAGAERIIAVKDMTVPKIRLSRENADITGGFILRHGTVEINCSIEEMIRARKETGYAAVAGILFA